MELICTLFALWLVAVFVRIVLSWFPVTDEGAMGTLRGVLGTITDPVLRPLRAVLPPVQLGGMGLDLSPLIVMFVGSFLLRAIC